MLHVVVDADPVVYAAGFVSQQTKWILQSQFDGEYVTEFDTKREMKAWLGENNLDEADFQVEEKVIPWHLDETQFVVDGIISKMVQTLQADSYTFYLTSNEPGDNYRFHVALQALYKGKGRASKPYHYHNLRDYFLSRYKAVVTRGNEADDACAIQLASDPDNTIVASVDKDLLQVPGRHYNLRTHEVTTISLEEGRRRFWTQVLTGDTTDNIPGLFRIGEKKAASALSKCDTEEDYYKVALELYQKQHGDTGKYLLIEQARLLYMQRTVGEVWHPPSI